MTQPVDVTYKTRPQKPNKKEFIAKTDASAGRVARRRPHPGCHIRSGYFESTRYLCYSKVRLPAIS